MNQHIYPPPAGAAGATINYYEDEAHPLIEHHNFPKNHKINPIILMTATPMLNTPDLNWILDLII